MTVKLLKPVTVGTRLTVRASFPVAAVAGKRMYRVAATAALPDGTVVATASSTCVKVR
jgi:hypothetical protein